MKQGFKFENNLDSSGRPAGGYVDGTGMALRWQNGPLGRVGTEERKVPNGAFVEDVIRACVRRIEHYQEHFPCMENATALAHLDLALQALDSRTQRRTADKTEGTHEGT